MPAATVISADSEATAPALLLFNADWALSPLLRRYWSFGYRAEDLAAMFDAVPPALRFLLCRATAAAQQLEES